MKRTIIALVAIIIFGCVGAYAQSANRKGFFAEVQGGAVLGYMYKSDIEINGKPKSYMKSGFDLGIGLGYRFRTSTHWAFQTKLAFSDNLNIASLFNLSLLLGMRWTSNDFSGNKSAFIGLNTGYSLCPGDYGGHYFPIDFEVGLNLIKKISLGLFITPRICLPGYEYSYENVYGYCPSYYQTNSVLGVRFGYRF